MKMLKEPEVLTKDICALIFNNMGKYRGEPFLLTSKGSAPLSDILLNKTVSQNEVDLVFMDPSTEQLIPGWPLRNLIAAVAYSRFKSFIRSNFAVVIYFYFYSFFANLFNCGYVVSF